MNAYARVFGSGPLGLAISVALLAGSRWLQPLLPGPATLAPYGIRLAALLSTGAFALALAVWSFRSLPPEERGRKLCQTGAFHYLRHPLYAAFLSLFNFGLALYLNHWIYLLWAVSLHPLWHYLMRSEEQLMVRELGDEYVEYAERTGRFWPRPDRSAR